MKTKALFLFAGLGGYAYPFYQSGEYDITFVELDENIIPHLQAKYPEAKVICGDAIHYLERNYKDFDLIYASPPCVANSRISRCFNVRIPSLIHFEIELFLKKNYTGDYVVENTIPYYYIPFEYSIVGRHLILSNFRIPIKKGFKSRTLFNTNCARVPSESGSYLNKISKERPELQNIDFNKIKYRGKKQLYNNTMELEVSTYIFDCYQKHRGIKLLPVRGETIPMFGESEVA